MGYAEFERYANDRVEDLLDAYADARLEPAGPVLARIRANVMAHAAAAAATHRVLDTPTLAPATSRFALAPGAAPAARDGPRSRRQPDARHDRGGARRTARQPVLQRAAGHRDRAHAVGREHRRSARGVRGAPRRSAWRRPRPPRPRGDAAGARGRPRRLPGRGRPRRSPTSATTRIASPTSRRCWQSTSRSSRRSPRACPTEVARQNAVEHAISQSERAVERINQKQAGGNQGGGGNGNRAAERRQSVANAARAERPARPAGRPPASPDHPRRRCRSAERRRAAPACRRR